MENNQITEDVGNKKATKKIALFLGIIGLVGASYGAYWFSYGSKFEDTENAYVNANQVAVSSSVSGSITGIYVSDTMRVNKNFVAIKVEDTDYKIALEKAENELAKSVRSYKVLKLKINDLKKSENDYTRERKTFDNGLISKEELENYKYKYEQAQIALDNAKVSVQSADNQAYAKSVKDHPDVSKSITQYRQAYVDLTRTVIKVPEDGIVAKKSVNIGQKVSSGQNLFTLIDEKNEWVDANLKESQLKDLQVGQEVKLDSDVNGKQYKGYIVAIGGGSGSSLSLLPAQNATGNWIKVVQRVPVRIVLDNNSLKNNGYLPIGTSMRVNIDTRNVKEVSQNIIQEIAPSYDEKALDKKINQIINENLGK